MKQIEALLRETIGLHAATIGSKLIEHAVAARMGCHGLSKPGDYVSLLRASPAEWTALVESVVVSETWFFRDREPFHALAGLVQREWLPAHSAGQLRILSAPCSTGEEPYSIAMTLLDAGLSPARFQIDALDIRPSAIAFAQYAVFGKSSFRGKDLSFRAQHFRPAAPGHALNESVRKLVRFQTGNLLDEKCLPQTAWYDFIFCRNLLIYFDRPTQERTLGKLSRLLTKTGILFVGSAETPIAAHCGFVSAQLPQSFACRNAPAHHPAVKPSQIQFEPGVEAKSTVPHQIPSPVLVPGEPFTAREIRPPDLSLARRLANDGRLGEAAEICENYLKQCGVSAEAYYLLGLVRGAAGADSQAGEFYRRALYLEPDHYDTVRQWAQLSAKSGDGARAQILTERAERIRKTRPETS